MRKLAILSITIFVSILAAGLYGIIHDQVTYSISPEYFTKFKFRQFGFNPAWFGGNRQTVAVIGFMATWWMGMFIGIMVGVTGLGFKDHIIMKRQIIKAFKIIFCITIAFSAAGYLYGKFYLADKGVNWWLPTDLVDKKHFIITGTIHNFSYAGGLAGLFIAELMLIRKRIFTYGHQ